MVNLGLNNDHRRQLVSEGGITTILRAMKAHPLDREVQFRAIFALINLVTDAGGNLQVDTRHRTQEPLAHSVTNVIIETADRFMHDVCICNRACMVIYNLSFDSFNLHFMRHKIKPLLEEMQCVHSQDTTISTIIHSTLKRLEMQ